MRWKLLALTVVILSHLVSPGVAYAACANPIFINELHYDNVGADVGEAVEIAGPAGTNLAGWTLWLYNGDTGTPYTAAIALSGLIADEGNGFGALAFPTAGIQNGSPDGLALVDQSGVVRQFLSYEGNFVATSGPATGMTSVDISVSETTNTPVGASLQLAGAGGCASDFSWSGPTVASFGALNSGQIVTTAPAVIGMSPADKAYDVPSVGALSVTFSEPVTVLGPLWLDCSQSGQHQLTATVNGLALIQVDYAGLRGGESCQATVPATSIADLEATPNQMLADHQWTFEVGYAATNRAVLFISDEEAHSRTVVDTQDDPWQTLALETMSCSAVQTGLLQEATDAQCGSHIGECVLPSTLASGLVISYTLRNMDGRPLGSADAWASGQVDGCNEGATLQDGAPRPTGLPGCYYSDAANFRGSTQHANGVLFTFSEPVGAFGAWFGDLETKPFGASYYHGGVGGGTGAGGALAYLRLFFEDGTMQEAPIEPTLAPGAPWLAASSPPPAVTLNNGGDVGFCGGANPATDGAGCGNKTTRWVGFVTDAGGPLVQQMLVVVGDDDHSGAGPSDGPNVVCGGDGSTCNAGTEFLSFIGPSACVSSDLSIDKEATPAVVRAGERVTYTLTYRDQVPGINSGPISISDQLPAGMQLLSLAADPPVTQLAESGQWLIAGLPAGATGWITYSVVLDLDTSGFLTNLVTIATAGDRNLQNNSAGATIFVTAPGIAVRTLLNGLDPSISPGPRLADGDPMIWTYYITNTGNIPLTGLALNSDGLPLPTCQEGDWPTTLPVGGAITCTAVTSAHIGSHGQAVFAAATPQVGPASLVTATAVAYYEGIGYTTLTLVPQVVNDDDGTATAADFTRSVNGQPVEWSTPISLAIGVATVTISTHPGYELRLGGDCEPDGIVMLHLSAPATCIIGIDDLPALPEEDPPTDPDPGGDTPVDPGVPTDPGPGGDTPDDPAPDNPPDPDPGNDTPVDPGNPANPDPSGDTPADPNPDTPVDPDSGDNTPSDPGNIPTDPDSGGDAPVDPGPDIPTDPGPGGDTPSDPGNTPNDPHPGGDTPSDPSDPKPHVRILGRVWHDRNANGSQDLDEPGLAAVWVMLYGGDGVLVSTTMTDSAGHYRFDDLRAGHYGLAVAPPPGHGFTQLDATSEQLDSDIDPASGRTPVIYAAEGATFVLDAGMISAPQLHFSKTTTLPYLWVGLRSAQVVTYTLSYTNTGAGVATGVRLRERVAIGAHFEAGASTPGWTCEGGGGSGANCTYLVGDLRAGDAGALVFAIAVHALPTGNRLENTAYLDVDDLLAQEAGATIAFEASATVEMIGPTALEDTDEPGSLAVQVFLPWVTR